MATPSAHRYTLLKEFYPFYLSEHRDPTCRVLHFTGTRLIVLWVILAVVLRNAMWLLMVPLVAYGFAWAGHYFFEKNTPATFQYPGYSLASDFILWWELLTGKRKFRTEGS